MFDLESSLNKRHRRRGRGVGCSKGKTCGRGHKGQRARSGGKRFSSRSRQMPINRRLSKRGFSHKKKLLIKAISLKFLNYKLKSNEYYSTDSLKSILNVKSKFKLKLLSGTFKLSNVVICCEKISATAQALVHANACSIELANPPPSAQLTFSIRNK
ncbi:MAG: 50S ribosomal protein L15, partial [Candidatus Hodgkinia cicadicola]